MKTKKRRIKTNKKRKYINRKNKTFKGGSELKSTNQLQSYEQTFNRYQYAKTKMFSIQRMANKNTKLELLNFNQKSPEEVIEFCKNFYEKLKSENPSVNSELNNVLNKELNDIEQIIKLKKICSDIVLCMMLYSKDIKSVFDSFNFDSLNDIKKISEGGQGTIHRLTYEKYGYEINTILKSNKFGGGNLYYEYLVGQYINTLLKKFPCFIETYNILHYKKGTYDPETYRNTSPYMVNNLEYKQISKNGKQFEIYEDEVPYSWLLLHNYSYQFKENINKYLEVYNSITLEKSTNNQMGIAILIQYIEGKTLFEMLKDKDFIKKDLLNVLYQIYMPLCVLSEQFTHYDLHSENILIYELKNKYLNYKYTLPNNVVVEFKSKYIIKIIDYGRCFINSSMSLKMELNSLKKKFEANKEKANKEKANKEKANTQMRFMGLFTKQTTIYTPPAKNPYNAGFNHLEYETIQGSKAFGVSSKVNQSIDLRLLYSIKDSIKVMTNKGGEDSINSSELPNKFMIELDKIKYGEGFETNEDYKRHHSEGTKENTEPGYPEHINNVTDAHDSLKYLIEENKTQNDNDYSNIELYGTLRVYHDKDMHFEPVLGMENGNTITN